MRAARMEEVLPALDALQAAVRDGRHAAGYLAYEAGYALDPALAGAARTAEPATVAAASTVVARKRRTRVMDVVVDMVQVMVRQPVKVIKDKKLVQELQDLALKVDKCHYIDVFQREDLQILIQRIS